MACMIDLGSGIFFAPHLNLHLALRASVEMLFPARAMSLKSVEDLKDVLYSGIIWVDQVPELKLHVHINAGPDLERSLSIFTSQIGDIICTSKFWLELGLGITFRSCDYISEQVNSTTIQLSFGLRRRPPGSITTETGRRLGMIKSSADAAPPAYFPVAHISAINIFMIYNHRIEKFLHMSSSTVTDNLPKGHQPSHWMVGELKLDQHHQELTAAANSENRGLTILMEEHSDIGDDWEHYRNPSQASTLQQCAHYTSPSSGFSFLFDIGFRTLMIEKPVEFYKHPILKENKLQSLSRIAPSVFSPGYREAMTERSQLMSSIAKSMCSILKSRRNRLLQDRVTILESSHRRHHEGLSMIPDAMDTKTIIVTSLWCIAQKQLYKPKASRKLSPLWPIPRSCSSRDTIAGSSTEIIRFQDDDDIEAEGSDYYIGTDGNDEDSYVLDEASSLLSHGEYKSDYSDIITCQDTQPGSLEHSQITLNSNWQNIHDERYISPAIDLVPDSLSDDEMLVSDRCDGYVSSPVPTSYMEWSCGKENDVMLCD
ncbi:hypothetical protein BBP40_004720 [Aspergillus hancockii]|nr:hypothetical protein BBP40_004720 [Aspergillus hancockii]